MIKGAAAPILAASSSDNLDGQTSDNARDEDFGGAPKRASRGKADMGHAVSSFTAVKLTGKQRMRNFQWLTCHSGCRH
jgi:hypothetical protein